MEQIQITEKNNGNTGDIAKWIRQELKKQYPDFKFSVTTEYYSGGSSINLRVMESPIKLVKKFDEISNNTIELMAQYRNDNPIQFKEYVKSMQEHGHYQLNQYSCLDEYDEHKWNNGVFLTEKGHAILKGITEIANKHNWDKSDIMTDYFNVNYYLHLSLGKWDKHFIDGVD